MTEKLRHQRGMGEKEEWEECSSEGLFVGVGKVKMASLSSEEVLSSYPEGTNRAIPRTQGGKLLRKKSSPKQWRPSVVGCTADSRCQDRECELPSLPRSSLLGASH